MVREAPCVITGTATVLFQGVSVEDILFILDNLTLLRLNRDRFLRLGRLRYNLRALTILGVFFVSVRVWQYSNLTPSTTLDATIRESDG